MGRVAVFAMDGWDGARFGGKVCRAQRGKRVKGRGETKQSTLFQGRVVGFKDPMEEL